MGPRSRERGNLARQCPVAGLVFASMGPRSRERGNASFGASAAAVEVLQWGRAHVSAEISFCLAWHGNRGWLQWGRAHGSAEILRRCQPRGPCFFFNGAALT